MLDPNTPAGTKVLCVDVRGCFSSCACAGNHPLGPLKEGRVYTVEAVCSRPPGESTPLAGYSVRVEEIDRSDDDDEDVGYAPERFIPLEQRWQTTRGADRAPVRSKKLEEA